jgi:hypothetical protein
MFSPKKMAKNLAFLPQITAVLFLNGIITLVLMKTPFYSPKSDENR